MYQMLYNFLSKSMRHSFFLLSVLLPLILFGESINYTGYAAYQGFQPVAAPTSVPDPTPQISDTPARASGEVHLPFIISSYRPPLNKLDMLLGIYPNTYWDPMPQDVINKEFHPINNWAGKQISIAGVFHDLLNGTDGNVNYLLGVIWDNGYTPFVNLYANASAASIASGKYDSKIRAWARHFAAYAQQGSRMAFLAPLQEMNGYWVPYGLNPVNYKLAYERIQYLFALENVPESSVRWVFAPNGYSNPGDPPFEAYYPGAERVDVVALSSYNFGYFPANPHQDWKNPGEVFTPYVERMQILAPNKAIFIAQTGTTAYTSNGWDSSAKDVWLSEAYTLLAEEEDVQAVIYFNGDIDYDWAFYKPGSVAFSGYVDGVAHPLYNFISPQELQMIDRYKR